MSLSKIANNQKRKLVSDDGSTEEPWSKKQRQQLGLPALFQIFEGKMPRLGDEDEKSMDVAINIYGTAEEPIFLAADVRKLCNYEDSRIRKQVGLWEDSRYAFKRTVLNPTATGNARKTQTVWLLTEAGLYRFLMASRNKSAKVVADWLFFQVIPALRSTKKALLDVIQTGRGIIENEDYQVIIQNGAVKSTKKETDARSVVDSLYPELDWKDVLSRCSQSTSPEKAIADKLQTQLGGIREYPVPGGKIDLLTETEIIEVKAIEQFKQAVGQVKYYAHALNSDKHTQRVHLFAPDKDYSAFNVERIVSFVATLNVQVTFE